MQLPCCSLQRIENMRKLPVSGLSQRSLRVCQAKRVAPPIVPESSASAAGQQHRHSGSSFDSGGSSSTETSSGGYCSGSGSQSSFHTPYSSTWSQAGSDQRSSIGLEDTAFLPPPPSSPSSQTVGNIYHMYSLGENEPVYSGRNLGSPGSGSGSSGIFTYPTSANNPTVNTGAYGSIGQYRSKSVHQPSATHVSFAMDHPTSPDASATISNPTLLSHPNYSHQLSMEDQGIDLTQSPGRESPSSSSSTASVGLKSNLSGGSSSGGSATSATVAGSSSCRYSTTSTTSLDSGRASGTYDLHHHHHHTSQRHCSTSSSSTTSSFHLGGQMMLQHQQQLQRFSGQSYESGLRNSYHSSSSSLGSSGGGAGGKVDDIHRLNISEMLSQGVPEHEILNAWLTDLGFEEYYDLFVQSGYDMHTITRMTPEDLTAIGIQKPNHRKKLKAEIALLQMPDGLPDFKPETLEEWLALLGLAEYSPSLRRQGYRTVEDVTQLTWEDLEDFGILRLGHQKKIMLAIKRIKDIITGKYVPYHVPYPDSISSPGTDLQDKSISSYQYQNGTPSSSSSSSSSHYAVPPSVMRPVLFPLPSQQRYPHYQRHYQSPQQPQQQQQQQHQQQQHHQQQQQQHQQQLKQEQQLIYCVYQQPTYQPDVVAIQVHRNRSSEDIRAGQSSQTISHSSTELSVLHQTFCKPGWRQRSYEDGDVTPVSEHSHQLLPQGQNVPGGGTLPRPRGTVKPRPVAKISAKTRSECSPDPSTLLHDDLKAVSINQSQQIQQPFQCGTMAKKNPPPAPPKRASSSSTPIENESSESIYGRNAKSSPLPLPPPPSVNADAMSLLVYSDDSEDFPPPPAPITASDSYLQHSQHASSAAASVRERLDNILQRTGAGHWPTRPHIQPQTHYGMAIAPACRPNGSIPNIKMVSNREGSPNESIETSDTDPGSPALEFRQRRNGSDASFKSTSSTESDSMPFANDNVGTIKQRNARAHPALAGLTYSSSVAAAVMSPSLSRRATTNNTNLGTSDVLNDIGNMLADLTDELDSMLEEENSAQPEKLKS